MIQYDKLAHFFATGILSLVLNCTLGFRKMPVRGIRILLGSFIVSATANICEVAQAFTPYRTFDVFDMVANTLGVAFFSWIAMIWIGKSRNVPAKRGT